VLKWPIRIASIAAGAVVAYGWGDFARDPSAAPAVLLALLTVIFLVALARLYRPGGMAAFDELPDGAARRAPGEAGPDPAPYVPPPAPRRSRQPREKPARGRAERPRRAEPPPTPVPPPAPASSAERSPTRVEPASPLWSAGRAPAERPEPGPPPPSPASAAAPAASWSDAAGSGPLDLNAATAEELATLPGIGRGAATRVVAHREAHGPFASVSRLGDVEGFDAGRVARVAGRLRV